MRASTLIPRLAPLLAEVALVPVLIGQLVGCGGGDSSGGAASSDAGMVDSGAPIPVNDASSPLVEAGTVFEAGVDANRATACTAAPFIGFSANVDSVGPLGSTATPSVTAPLAGASVSFTTCAGFVVTADATGLVATSLTAGIATSPFYSFPGYVGVVGAEVAATSDAYAKVSLFAFGSTPFTGYDTTKATLHVVLDARASAPCDQVDGVALQVVDHPEAVAHYMMPDWPNNLAESSSGVSVGEDVFFSGLAGGQRVTVTGTKPGCQVVASGVAQTGFFVLSNSLISTGTVSLGLAVK